MSVDSDDKVAGTQRELMRTSGKCGWVFCSKFKLRKVLCGGGGGGDASNVSMWQIQKSGVSCKAARMSHCLSKPTFEALKLPALSQKLPPFCTLLSLPH